MQASDLWWDAKDQFQRSHATVKYQLVKLVDGLGVKMPLNDLTLSAIDGYIAKRRAKVGNASVNRETGLLRQVINWCEARGYEVPKIQCKEAKLTDGAALTRVLTSEEKARLFEALPDSLRPIVEFAILSGQRKNEIATMRWADVDFPNAGRQSGLKGKSHTVSR